MNDKTLTLSIVIPVYNEERYLKACLNAIQAQTVKPDEVIVVDNNSTDRSARIAENYLFVRVIKESRQSQVYAQKTGFDVATSDIIGRIDSDTLLPPKWVATVKDSFLNDPKTVAITGAALPYDVQFKRTGKFIQRFYQELAGVVAGKRMLWGANCALRRSAWCKISPDVQQRSDIWEDFDMSFLLHEHGKTRYLKGIDVGLSFRAVHKSFWRQFTYQLRAIRTFYYRTGLLKAAILTPLWLTQLLIYPLTVFDEHIAKPFSRRK